MQSIKFGCAAAMSASPASEGRLLPASRRSVTNSSKRHRTTIAKALVALPDLQASPASEGPTLPGSRSNGEHVRRRSGGGVRRRIVSPQPGIAAASGLASPASEGRCNAKGRQARMAQRTEAASTTTTVTYLL